MKILKYGIIGLGNMGSIHMKHFISGYHKNAELTAICDTNSTKLKAAADLLDNKIFTFESPEEMIKSGKIEAVIIATPHYIHPDLAILALKNKIHAMVEKPAGVYTKQVKEMNEVATANKDTKLGIMFNNRTNPIFQKARELVLNGEIGELKRTNWIITDWYRTQFYYDSGDWRATWAGEGGGVLMNQSPHQLDLWQWICGMPIKVRAFCKEGDFHNIEVEDNVTAYVEYANGATGVFITSTGDAPGTNRFEILGDKGKIVMEGNDFKFWKLTTPEKEFTANSKTAFNSPEVWEIKVPVHGSASHHAGIINNFTDAILFDKPMLADGKEGINGVELANAMYLSSWIGESVDIPVDSELYFDKLKEKISISKYKKSEQDVILNLDGSY